MSDAKEQQMQYARLGSSGLKVSRICLGCMSYGTSKWRPWVLDHEPSLPFIKRALEMGINFFDTADMYSEGESEIFLGNAIRQYATRDEVVIASKVYFPMPPKGPNTQGLSRKHIMSAVDASLKRLGTDYIDLYQIHRWDNDTPIEETMGALNDLVRCGKVRYIGASSMFTWQMCKAQYLAESRGWAKFISMQNHYNLVYREEEREMNPYCVDSGVGLIPWSPLARGFLAGNRKKTVDEGKSEGSTVREKTDTFAHSLYYQDCDFQIVDRVVELAAKKKVAAASLGLAWLLNKPGVVAPIIGATKMSHLEDAVAAVNVKLSPEEMTFLEELYKPHAVLGHGVTTSMPPANKPK